MPALAESILITGASGGLGGAIARRYAETGARLALHCHHNRAAVDALAAGLDAEVFAADLSRQSGCDSLLKGLHRWAPNGINGLIHAAGPTRDGAVVGLGEAEWDAVLGTHLLAPARLLNSGLMQAGGFAVLIGSGAGRFGRAGQASYAAAKAGMIGLTEGMARTLGRDGIRINTVVPGPLDTPMWRATPPVERKAILQANALATINTVEQVAEFIYLLGSMPATSGQVLNIGSRVPW